MPKPDKEFPFRVALFNIDPVRFNPISEAVEVPFKTNEPLNPVLLIRTLYKAPALPVLEMLTTPFPVILRYEGFMPFIPEEPLAVVALRFNVAQPRLIPKPA